MDDVTEDSLVLVDELGKGTEVRAGAAIAGAMLERLDTIGCRGIFATSVFFLIAVILYFLFFPLLLLLLVYRLAGWPPGLHWKGWTPLAAGASLPRQSSSSSLLSSTFSSFPFFFFFLCIA